MGKLGFLANPLDLLLPQPIGFHQLCLKFLLHGQGNFQGDWVHQLDQELTDGSVNLPARNLLALWLGILDAVTLANVRWTEAATAEVIPELCTEFSVISGAVL